MTFKNCESPEMYYIVHELYLNFKSSKNNNIKKENPLPIRKQHRSRAYRDGFLVEGVDGKFSKGGSRYIAKS